MLCRLPLLGLAVISMLSSGCYYGHLASGQLRLLWARQPIERVIDDPGVPEETQSMLRIVRQVRAFAAELGLRVDDQYTSYVEWPGDRVVTTLVRTRPPSVEPVPYWFPFVGSLPYKGYFDRARAESEAERLRQDGEFDVCVSGVAAYSTLGWMDDPITTPMLRRGPESLVETLLHELVHATAFVASDADFNESVAQFIGQEAAVQFFVDRARERVDVEGGDEAPRAASPAPEDEIAQTFRWPDPVRVRQAIEDQRKIAEELISMKEALTQLEAGPMRQEKRAAMESATRARMAALPLQVINAEKAAKRARLNDACLALRGAYLRDLPRHERVFNALGMDLEAMISRLGEVAAGRLTTDDYYRVMDLAREAEEDETRRP